MDQSNTGQSISDDQELAKVLAGVTSQPDDAGAQVTTDDNIVTAPPVEPQPEEAPAQTQQDAPEAAPISPEPNFMPTPTEAVASPVVGSNDLDTVKQEALQELRPLVDKLNVSPEEKFDTYLLLLRSTDDKALIEPAHESAKGIVDEARRAQALLDIIKEIDFLNQNNAA